MNLNDVYLDVDGDPLALRDLDADERRLVARLRRRARTHPDWSDFDNYWMRQVGAFYDDRGLPRSESRKKIPYQIAQDLSARLGIAAGQIQPPGPFDDLDEIIQIKFGSVPAFCKATGISSQEIHRFMVGRGDLSLTTLLKGLEKIGYRLRITPAAPPIRTSDSRNARNNRSKRTARSA